MGVGRWADFRGSRAFVLKMCWHSVFIIPQPPLSQPLCILWDTCDTYYRGASMPPRNDAGDLSSFGAQAKSTLSPSRNAALITDCRWCESGTRYIRVYFTQPISTYFVSHCAQGRRAEGGKKKKNYYNSVVVCLSHTQSRIYCSARNF